MIMALGTLDLYTKKSRSNRFGDVLMAVFAFIQIPHSAAVGFAGASGWLMWVGHGVTDDDMRHAYRNPIRVAELDDLVMLVGPR